MTPPPAARLQAKPAPHPLGSNQAPPAATSWLLYVIRCGDGSLYCGITNNLARRFAQHQTGKGARYTRGRGPLLLLRTWPQPDKPTALRAELAFKRLSRANKEQRLQQT